jgi:hypothetical protein
MTRAPATLGSPAGGSLRSHLTEWPLLVVLAAALALRVVAVWAYRPALLSPDGTSYLAVADRLQPAIQRPAGYSLFLRVIGAGGDLIMIPLVQHGLVLVLVILLYALLRRRSAPPWLAAVALLPLALDARQVAIEHMVLSEALFLALLLAAVLFLTLPRHVGVGAAAAAGLAIGLAGLVRSTGLPLVVLLLLFLLVTRARWVLHVALVAGVLLPVGAYAVWYHSEHGAYALSQYDGHFLYGRVAGFADCRGVDDLTEQESRLCETTGVDQRGNATYYVWGADSPGQQFKGVRGDAVLGSFARKVLLAHPGAWVRATVRDTLPYFVPGAPIEGTYLCDMSYRFPRSGVDADCFVYVAAQDMAGKPTPPEYAAGPGGFLQGYQDVMTTPPLVFGLLTLVVLGSSVVAVFRRRWRAQAEALLFGGIAVGLVVLASATTMYDVRYGFQMIAMLPVAAVLAVLALRRPGQRAVESVPVPDEPSAEGHDTAPIAALQGRR